MPLRFSSRRTKLTGVRTHFSMLAFGIVLTTLPGVAYAQLRVTSAANTFRIPDDRHALTAPVGTPAILTKAKANEFGAVAQNVMVVSSSGPNAGTLTGNAHACAGTGGEELYSAAYGSGTGNFDTPLRLVSSTLAVGTPVDVEFRYKAKVNAKYIADSTFDWVTVYSDLSISAQGAGQNTIVRGLYSYQSVRSINKQYPTITGLFDEDDGVTRRLVGVPVGSVIHFSAALTLYTEATASGYTYNSGDIKAGVIWGGQALSSGVSLVYGPSDTLFPSLSNVNEPNLNDALPPFQLPVDSGISSNAPEPGTFALLLLCLPILCLSVSRRIFQVNQK